MESVDKKFVRLVFNGLKKMEDREQGQEREVAGETSSVDAACCSFVEKGWSLLNSIKIDEQITASRVNYLIC